MRLGHGNHPVNKPKFKLFLTDGLGERLTGFCLFFAKINKSKEVTALNVHLVSCIYFIGFIVFHFKVLILKLLMNNKVF